MPTPIEILLNPVSLAVIAMYAGLMLWEAIAPAGQLPKIPGWRLKGLGAFLVFFFLSSYLPLLWDSHLARFQLLDLSALGTYPSAAIGLLAYELCGYWYHRSMHSSNVLFRTLHQMHHSSERLDAVSAFYFSPLDMVGWTFIASLALVVIGGLSAAAATIVLLTVNFLAILQHTNIRTPRWLGYFVQRPESHRIHHGRGIHRYNYADLPVLDMIFGTFRNAHAWEPQTGFYDGASSRVLDMLLFRDVSRERPNA